MKVNVFMRTGYGKRSARGRSDSRVLYVSAFTTLARLARVSTPQIGQNELLIHFSFFRAKSLLSANQKCSGITTRLKRHG